ncbi:EEF1A lysine methyltransferase 2 [Cylas formicarius]|uniref:EEF1A lysine methyltransferase 2 n=1 Tax=Cylas formicarius TaxID=197179 RepID=UPI002958A613|nr:EEF1A lysine methyltransferase 2 [Cylas formicarius]
MEELESSELGTLEYWENRYKNEIKNFQDHGDTGEIWFGEDIADRIVRWFIKNVEPEASIVDIGCGNGLILIELANAGYKNLTGLDYSEEAINLANNIAKKRNLSVKYHVSDVLNGIRDNYKIIHDKGTYDAISLSEGASRTKQTYLQNVHKCLNDSGKFIITSCNWTENELIEQFSNYFVLESTVQTPQFKFGGKIGNVVSICIFKKIPT